MQEILVKSSDEGAVTKTFNIDDDFLGAERKQRTAQQQQNSILLRRPITVEDKNGVGSRIRLLQVNRLPTPLCARAGA
jgi:hypothetical protein